MGKVRCARFVEMGGMSRVPEPGRSQCTLGHVNESAWRWRESRTGNFALEAAEGKVKIQRVYVVEPAAARRWRGALPCGCGILHHTPRFSLHDESKTIGSWSRNGVVITRSCGDAHA